MNSRRRARESGHARESGRAESGRTESKHVDLKHVENNADDKQDQALVRAFALAHFQKNMALKRPGQTKKAKRPPHSFRRRQRSQRKTRSHRK